MTGGAKCVVCKLVALLAGIGALNWGLVTFVHVDLVQRLLGSVPAAAKVVYGLVGVSGALLLVSLVKCCPCSGGGGGSCGSKK